MPARERHVDRGSRRGHSLLRDVSEDLRRARITAGLSQQEVARAIGVSYSTLGRIERARSRDMGLVQLSRALAVVGLELSARAYPVGSPLRDRAHAELLEKLRICLHPSLRWRTEVPFPNQGDLRAWDALIAVAASATPVAPAAAATAGRTSRAGVEAETRPRDGQELERRLAIKRRDGGVDRLIVLLSDTRSNRALVRERSASLAAAFPMRTRVAVAALQAGRLPDADALILL